MVQCPGYNSNGLVRSRAFDVFASVSDLFDAGTNCLDEAIIEGQSSVSKACRSLTVVNESALCCCRGKEHIIVLVYTVMLMHDADTVKRGNDTLQWDIYIDVDSLCSLAGTVEHDSVCTSAVQQSSVGKSFG